MSGNCARIRRAFVLGARTLRGVLHASEADVSTELYQFFKNCNLRYNVSYQRPDVAGPRSSQGIKIPNGVQRMGGAKRSDIEKIDRNEDIVLHASVSQNGDHSPQARLYHNLLPVDPKVREASHEALGSDGEYEGAPILSPSAVELASGGDESSKESAGNLISVPGEERATLNFRESKIAFNGPNGDVMFHDSHHIDEEPIRGAEIISKRILSQIGSLQIVCDRLPVRPGVYGENELSPVTFSERDGSGHKTREGLEGLVADMGVTGVLKQVTTANGNQHSTNGSTSPCSKIDSEEEEESSSQSSSSKGEVAASENCTVLGVPDPEGGLLPLSCRPGN